MSVRMYRGGLTFWTGPPTGGCAASVDMWLFGRNTPVRAQGKLGLYFYRVPSRPATDDGSARPLAGDPGPRPGSNEDLDWDAGAEPAAPGMDDVVSAATEADAGSHLTEAHLALLASLADTQPIPIVVDVDLEAPSIVLPTAPGSAAGTGTAPTADTAGRAAENDTPHSPNGVHADGNAAAPQEPHSPAGTDASTRAAGTDTTSSPGEGAEAPRAGEGRDTALRHWSEADQVLRPAAAGAPVAGEAGEPQPPDSDTPERLPGVDGAPETAGGTGTAPPALATRPAEENDTPHLPDKVGADGSAATTQEPPSPAGTGAPTSPSEGTATPSAGQKGKGDKDGAVGQGPQSGQVSDLRRPRGPDAVRGREGSLAVRGSKGRVRVGGQAAGDSVHRPGRSPADREDGHVSTRRQARCADLPRQAGHASARGQPQHASARGQRPARFRPRAGPARLRSRAGRACRPARARRPRHRHRSGTGRNRVREARPPDRPPARQARHRR